MGLSSGKPLNDYRHNDTPQEGGAAIYARDEDYYLNTVTFLVEDYLYNVPSCIFENGCTTLVSQMQAALGSDGKQAHPILLEGVRRVDFGSLLRVILPLDIKPRPLSLDEWISVLRLSTEWKLAAARDLAIETMSLFDMEPTEKITLSRDFAIEAWYGPACEELAARSEALTLEEAQKVGIEAAVKVFHLRERTRPCTCSASVPAAAGSGSAGPAAGPNELDPAPTQVVEDSPRDHPEEITCESVGLTLADAENTSQAVPLAPCSPSGMPDSAEPQRTSNKPATKGKKGKKGMDSASNIAATENNRLEAEIALEEAEEVARLEVSKRDSVIASLEAVEADLRNTRSAVSTAKQVVDLYEAETDPLKKAEMGVARHQAVIDVRDGRKRVHELLQKRNRVKWDVDWYNGQAAEAEKAREAAEARLREIANALSSTTSQPS